MGNTWYILPLAVVLASCATQPHVSSSSTDSAGLPVVWLEKNERSGTVIVSKRCITEHGLTMVQLQDCLTDTRKMAVDRQRLEFDATRPYLFLVDARGGGFFIFVPVRRSGADNDAYEVYLGDPSKGEPFHRCYSTRWGPPFPDLYPP